jgi:hypothetical protein
MGSSGAHIFLPLNFCQRLDYCAVVAQGVNGCSFLDWVEVNKEGESKGKLEWSVN